MKNCEVALSTAWVRAIDSVPRSLSSPLSASFSMGSRVGLRCISSVNPPPWITNPGMTRWKIVPS
ncbi:hypothetical protein KBTX_04354 [wastewater metagenome]|uniref:Uncharacterized protein n=2 Tax=unclassified sequences TaxID=12908 RepID=A0A5B8RJ00_9ZZZZ|nr:hypothetical protein KBTEX_04354 [uncultured organism]